MPEFPLPSPPRHDAVQSSYLILKYAHDTAESLLEAFNTVRRARNARQGSPTDEEQDLLRAMVVFAGAGIDSMTKQLIRDALPKLVEVSQETRDRIAQLGARHLRRGFTDGDESNGEGSQGVSPQRLARVLMAENPRRGMMEILIDDLTSGSLQSASELYKVLGYFGVSANAIGCTEAELREVFDCRNKLIHEMDIDFARPNRNRRSRPRDDMMRYTRVLLTAGENILAQVNGQLPQPPTPRRGRPPRQRV